MKEDPMGEQGRTAVVIGGTGGLGGAIAAAFINEPDCRVFITGATSAEVESAQSDPSLRGAEITVLDVRDNSAVTSYFSRLDRLDVLLNAAGIMSSPADFTPEGFERTVDINLTGTARVCFAAHSLLAASRGNIINFASVMSFRGTATGPAYSASKAGVMLLTKSLATAWGSTIRVNALAPGFIETPMTVSVRADAARSKRITDHTPAGRWGTPDELVGAALFLASDAAGFVNGIVLPVDGGYMTT